MTRSIRLLVGRSVCHNLLKGREVTLPCSYRSGCYIHSVSEVSGSYDLSVSEESGSYIRSVSEFSGSYFPLHL